MKYFRSTKSNRLRLLLYRKVEKKMSEEMYFLNDETWMNENLEEDIKKMAAILKIQSFFRRLKRLISGRNALSPSAITHKTFSPSPLNEDEWKTRGCIKLCNHKKSSRFSRSKENKPIEVLRRNMKEIYQLTGPRFDSMQDKSELIDPQKSPKPTFRKTVF